MGTVVDYEDRFEELRALVLSKNKGFNEEYFISSFISGLKDHIKGSVKMFKPQTLYDAVLLAKQEESKTSKPTGSSISKVGYSKVYAGSTDSKQVVATYTNPVKLSYAGEQKRARSTLSNKELLDRRAKGQCFHCDDLYHPEKDCKMKLYMMLGEIEEVFE